MTYKPESAKEKAFLADYDARKFPVIMVTVDCIVHRGDKILLIKRGGFPYRGHWAIPGGFLEEGETAAQAVRRELKEEAGLDMVEVSFLTVADQPDRDPRGRAISIVFTATVPADATAFAGDDAVEAKWFTPDQIREMDLAFDHRLLLKLDHRLRFE